MQLLHLLNRRLLLDRQRERIFPWKDHVNLHYDVVKGAHDIYHNVILLALHVGLIHAGILSLRLEYDPERVLTRRAI